jgi:hypothetical protein
MHEAVYRRAKADDRREQRNENEENKLKLGARLLAPRFCPGREIVTRPREMSWGSGAWGWLLPVKENENGSGPRTKQFRFIWLNLLAAILRADSRRVAAFSGGSFGLPPYRPISLGLSADLTRLIGGLPVGTSTAVEHGLLMIRQNPRTRQIFLM